VRRADRIEWRGKLFSPSRFAPGTFNTTRKKETSTVRAHRTLIISLTFIVTLALPSGALAARRLIIGGSTSVLPLAQKLAAAYHKAHKSIPAPAVSGGQSDIGIKGAANGEFDIGDSSRDPIKGVDPKGLIFVKIAHDGVCVITNKANSIANMSEATIQEIYTGQKRDWSEVPGARITGPITLFERTGSSGTQDAFQHIFLGEEKRISSSATPEASNGLEQQNVAAKKNAIGFVSFAYTGGVHPVSYNGIACNLANAKSGQYGGVRNFWMVVKGKPTGRTITNEAGESEPEVEVPPGPIKKFLTWVTSGNKTTKRIISSQWVAIH
jgi:phosphate transport system substrate-binding protein